ncbi:MAG: secretin N-terminal domain-containing protein [Candidatus Omnitrophica bacterium]|nr:secretin N-terminal domain-containing protein [Candidatus Omnitrophota bacterium]
MKRISITILAVFFLIFAFFIPHLNAEDRSPGPGPDVSISMDFKDASLKDILKVFSIQAGLNFIASEGVQDRKITLYLDKVPLAQAMDKIFSANNLSYELDDKANIFVVKEWGKVGTETVTKVFYLKNATVSTSPLREEMSKSLIVGSSGSNSTSVSSRNRFKEESEGGISSVVKKLLSAAGSMIEDFRTNSLIVTDTPMKINIIGQVIASLDIPVPQVILEVEMLDVSKNAVDKLGFEFGDTPFTAILTGATAATGFPFGSWSKTFDAAKGSLSINPTGSEYQMQLDFMRKQTDTKYLARPKLLTLNNETAVISVTKDEIVGRNDTTDTTSAGSTTSEDWVRSTDLALTKEGTGIFLSVTPQINLETNEVTMVIYPKSSVSSLSSLSTTENPQSDVEVRSTKSIVKVKDGETVVLGGLIHQDTSIVNKKLPILGDIPIIGAFFRHKYQSAGLERELIIFITPRIIRTNNNGDHLAKVPDVRMPIREQAAEVGRNRDYIINSNMNKFDKAINGKR